MIEAPSQFSGPQHSHHSHLEEDVSTLRVLPVQELTVGSISMTKCLVIR
jgi:hypothetical protein